MKILSGHPVVEHLFTALETPVAQLRAQGIVPCLALIRVGADPAAQSYARTIQNRFAKAQVAVQIVDFPTDVQPTTVVQAIKQLNQDIAVHGIMVLQPLPSQLAVAQLAEVIAPAKDVDSISRLNQAANYFDIESGFYPCTAEAVMALLDYYQINLAGQRVTVVGKSMVVGKPVALALMNRDATVTVAHKLTLDLQQTCQNADVIVACAGVPNLIDETMVHAGQVIIDVGINRVNGRLVGDVDWPAIQPIVAAATPVPGGVGTITTSILLKHTVQSAWLQQPSAQPLIIE